MAIAIDVKRQRRSSSIRNSAGSSGTSGKPAHRIRLDIGGHSIAFDGEIYRVTIAEAHALPEQEFRDLFCDAIGELVNEIGTSALDIAFLREGRAARDLTTGEMRQVVLAHQNLLNPPPPKVPHQPAPLTLALAHELLEIGAERGLKILFCEAVDALNAWRGQWSPLPAEPARCSTQEILDMLERHPHWFVPAAAE